VVPTYAVAARSAVHRTQFSRILPCANSISTQFQTFGSILPGKADAAAAVVLDGAFVAIFAGGAIRKLVVLAFSLVTNVLSAITFVTAVHRHGDTHAVQAMIADGAGIAVLAQAVREGFVGTGAARRAGVKRTGVHVVADTVISATHALLTDATCAVGHSTDATVHRTRFEDAPRSRSAGIERAWLPVRALQGRTCASQFRAVINQGALVVFAALVAVITAHTLFLPLLHARIQPLFGLVVAPGFLADVLGYALKVRAAQTVAIHVTMVINSTWVAVLTGSALGSRHEQVATSRVRIARGDQAVSRQVVFAGNLCSHTVSRGAHISGRTDLPVITRGSVLAQFEHTLPIGRVAPVDGARIVVGARNPISNALAVLAAPVFAGARVVVITLVSFAGSDHPATVLRTFINRTLIAIIAVVVAHARTTDSNLTDFLGIMDVQVRFRPGFQRHTRGQEERHQSQQRVFQLLFRIVHCFLCRSYRTRKWVQRAL